MAGSVHHNFRGRRGFTRSDHASPLLEALEPRLLLAGDLQISEFMAINDTTLADFQNAFPDWLEIHNISGGPMSLNGWHLTDDPTNLDRWSFPAITLDADEYLVVFASNKDLVTPTGELHTDFKIGSEDEVLALVHPDGETIEHSYDLTTITSVADVSYGVLPGDPAGYHMDSPTPGAANVRVSAEAAQYSVAGGTFTDSFSLTLSVNSPTGVIHYTTNGTKPTGSSSVYTAPLTISATTRVRTLVTEVGQSNGPVTSHTYIALAPDVQAFDSNLPLVVLDTHGSGVTSNESTMTFTSAVLIDTSGIDDRAAITDVADYAGRSGLRIRGSSSSNWPKKQYKLETWDETNDDYAASLLGMPSESDWVLYAPYSDKTLMRNYLVYKWFGEMGHYSVRTRYCEVFLNTGSGSVNMADYVGVYVLIEKIKADGDRVDVERMTPADSSAPEVTGGYILEYNFNEARADGTLGIDYFKHSNMYLSYIEPRGADITPAQRTYIANYLDSARSAMGGSSYGQWIDAESFVDVDLIQQLTKNNDSWYASVFMYKDREGLLTMGPVWDFNITLGNHHSTGTTPDGWIGSYAAWPWYSRLMAQADFSQMWTDRWGQFRQNVFDLDKMNADIDTTQALLAEAQVRDQAKWNTLGVQLSFNPPGAASRLTWQSEIDYMKTWLADRVAWVDSQHVAMPSFNLDGGVVPDDFEVAIDAPAGTTYYTTDGSDPRLPGGGINPQATAYSPGSYMPAPLVSAGSTWKYLATGIAPLSTWTDPAYLDTGWGSGPAVLGYGGAQTTIVSYGTNPLDKHTTTWFRKTFNLAGGVDLAGLTLRLKIDDGAMVYLNGHEVARVNMPEGEIDEDTLASGPATDDGTGWQEYFVPAGWLVDGTNALAAEVHQAAANSPDLAFDAELLMLLTVTPSATPIEITETTHVTTRVHDGLDWSAPVSAMFVTEAMSTLVITELNYNPYAPEPDEIAAGFTDANAFEFIELQNVGTDPISTLGLSFADGITFAFDETTIAPDARILLVANHSAFMQRYGFLPVAGQYDGSLDSNGETIALIDAAGRALHRFRYNNNNPWPGRADGKGASLEVIDTAGDYDDPSNWRSSGEYGGSPIWGGQGLLGDVVVNEVLTHTDLPATDAIELHNTTDAEINIGGWYLSDSDENFKKFRIPDGTTIAAGAYLVFDEHDFNATGLTPDPGDDDPNDFGLSGAHGDHVWLMAATPTGELVRFVDHVRFGAAFNSVPFGRYPNATGELTSLQTITLGQVNNDDPVIGPVIVSEIMYHPVGDNEERLEYIELFNVTDAPVPLDWYDSDHNGYRTFGEDLAWMLDGAVEFTFGAGTVIPAGGRLLVIDFAPTDAVKLNEFMTAYGLSGLTPGVDVVGGWAGQLSNGGEEVELYAFDSPPTGETFYPQVLMDLVEYSDTAPWPAAADGTGSSLHRAGVVYGNMAANWTADDPSPGTGTGGPPSMAADFNCDGTVDLEDFVILKQNFGSSTSAGDATGDGEVSLDDFVVLKQTFGNVGEPSWVDGDATGDGVVDLEDFVVVKQNFGTTDGASRAQGDLDCDGDVDLDDFVVVKQHFGTATAAPAVATSDDLTVAEPLIRTRATTSGAAAPEDGNVVDLLGLSPVILPTAV